MSHDPLDTPIQPLPDPDTAEFWNATAQGRLALCHCRACERWIQPPLARCPACWGKTQFDAVSGAGSLYSFIVVRHPSAPGYLRSLPQVIGLVELDEQPGLRLSARIVDAEPEKLRIGQRVQAEIVPLPGGDFRIPVFRTCE